jgi:hypothetical protein
MRRIIGTIGATLAVVAVLGASAAPASAEGWTTEGRWVEAYEKWVG